MKKIQVVFAAAAIVLAVTGVFASTAVTYTYYEKLNVSGIGCVTVITPAPTCTTGTQCAKITTSGGVSTTHYYSRAPQDSLGEPDLSKCEVVPGVIQ